MNYVNLEQKNLYVKVLFLFNFIEVTINANDYVKIKIKIAKMSTPILIKRCKETLKKYLDDEIKSGAMPLARF